MKVASQDALFLKGKYSYPKIQVVLFDKTSLMDSGRVSSASAPSPSAAWCSPPTSPASASSPETTRETS